MASHLVLHTTLRITTEPPSEKHTSLGIWAVVLVAQASNRVGISTKLGSHQPPIMRLARLHELHTPNVIDATATARHVTDTPVSPV